MKMRFQQNFLALAIFLASSTAAVSQTKTSPQAAVAVKPVAAEPTKEEIIAKLTVGKWHIAYLANATKKKNVTPDETDENWTAFKKDGTVQAAEDGDEHKGTWSYNHANKTIVINDRDGANKYRIISITAKELAVGTEMDGKPITMGMINR